MEKNYKVYKVHLGGVDFTVNAYFNVLKDLFIDGHSSVKQHLLELQVNNTIHFYTVPQNNVGN